MTSSTETFKFCVAAKVEHCFAGVPCCRLLFGAVFMMAASDLRCIYYSETMCTSLKMELHGGVNGSYSDPMLGPK